MAFSSSNIITSQIPVESDTYYPNLLSLNEDLQAPSPEVLQGQGKTGDSAFLTRCPSCFDTAGLVTWVWRP